MSDVITTAMAEEPKPVSHDIKMEYNGGTITILLLGRPVGRIGCTSTSEAKRTINLLGHLFDYALSRGTEVKKE